MLRHLGKIDLFKTLTRKFSAEARRLFEQFAATVPVGSQAPGFTLPAVTGARVSLAEYRGKKNVVVEFGSST